jgi:hypothetical protein
LHKLQKKTDTLLAKSPFLCRETHYDTDSKLRFVESIIAKHFGNRYVQWLANPNGVQDPTKIDSWTKKPLTNLQRATILRDRVKSQLSATEGPTDPKFDEDRVAWKQFRELAKNFDEAAQLEDRPLSILQTIQDIEQLMRQVTSSPLPSANNLIKFLKSMLEDPAPKTVTTKDKYSGRKRTVTHLSCNKSMRLLFPYLDERIVIPPGATDIEKYYIEHSGVRMINVSRCDDLQTLFPKMPEGSSGFVFHLVNGRKADHVHWTKNTRGAYLGRQDGPGSPLRSALDHHLVAILLDNSSKTLIVREPEHAAAVMRIVSESEVSIANLNEWMCKAIGLCWHCQRPLTNEESKKRGLGSECEKKACWW